MRSLSPRRRMAVWLIGLGAAIGPLDFALNVAFPAITEAFALQTQTIRWMALCYVTTYGALMLAFGALGDRIGHLRVFRAGLLLAALALTLAALAPSYPLLLAARVLQGVAVALAWSCAPALVISVHDHGARPADEARLAALASYGRLQAIASAAAPLLGGLSMVWLGWAGVFWFRIPLVLIAWLAVPWFVSARVPAADAASVATATATSAPRGVWSLLRRVRRERPSFLWINLGNTVVQFTGFTVPLITPYHLTRELHWSVLASGITVSVWAAGVWLGSALAGRLGRSVAPQRLLWGSALASVLTLWPFVAWPAAVPGVAGVIGAADAAGLWLIGLSMAVQGCVLGVYQVAYADAVVASLPDDARGVAGSLTIVTRTLGVILGATIWLWMLQQGDDPQHYMDWFRGMFVAAAAGGLLLVAVVARAALRTSPAARSAGT